MSGNYTIVRYRPEHKEDVVALQKHMWSPHSDLNRFYLEWKYERNPYLKDPLLYLAVCGGRVVGMRGMLGARWEVGKPPMTFLGICAEDSVIHPDHRNRRLSTKIMKTAFEDLAARGYRYLYSLSASPVTLMESLAMGWKNAGPFERQVLRSKRAKRFWILRDRIRKTRYFWRWGDRLPGRYWALRRTSLHELRDGPAIYRQTDRHRIVLDKSQHAGDMAELIARMEYNGRIRHLRDQEYLSWRYQNPMHRYLFLYWEEKLLEGYLVLQEYVSEFHDQLKVNIVDWEGTSSEVRAGLLHTALGLCPFPDLNIWEATLAEESKSLLQDAGFRPTYEGGAGKKDKPASLLVRSLQAGDPASEWALNDRRLLDMANWDLRMVYSMIG